MITITSSGSSIVFEFDDNQHYLQNGTIEVPVNSLMLVTDDSGMFTFKKSSTNDIFLSGLYTEIGMTKDELIEFYKENMVGEQGGSSSGITSGEVQTMIDESISGKADSSAVTEDIAAAVSGKVDNSVFEAYSGSVETALSGKVDTSAITSSVTSASTDSQVPTAKAVYDALGESGKPIEAGRGIDITTGETADTVSLNLSISAGTGTASIREGYNTTASGQYSHAEGNGTQATGNCAHAEGYWCKAFGSYSHAEGYSTSCAANNTHTEGNYTVANNDSEHASGKFNVSNKASNTFGNSGNTLFSVGNGTTNARHNAFEIRQNGDIYITSGGTDIKLQDNLGGGGGSSYTAGDGIDITNDVISVTGKVDTSAITSSVTSASTDSELPTAKAVYDALGTGGNANIIEVTQAEYDALVSGQTVDPTAMYVITDATEVNMSGYVQTSAITSAVTSASTNSEIPTALAVYAATSGGSGGGGVNVVQTTGTSTTDVMSQDAVTTALNNKANNSDAFGSYQFGSTNNVDYLRFLSVDFNNIGNSIYYPKINGIDILTSSLTWAQNNYNFQLVETSAITSAITSASTDSELPTAKAVNDKLGGLSIVKLTESEYAALVTKDSNTLYVVVPNP